jgi:hypothetical protein
VPQTAGEPLTNMIETEIQRLLRELADPASTTNSSIEARFDPSCPDRARRIEAEREQLLTRALETDKRLQPVHFIPVSHGSVGFVASVAAHEMLSRISTGNIEAATDWLEKVLQTSTAKAAVVKALYGVHCTERILLTDAIELIPFDDLPDSPQKRMLQPVLSSYDPLGYALRRRSPSAALLRTGQVEQFLISDPNVEIGLSWGDELDDALRILGLVSHGVPLDAGNWTQFDDSDLQAAAYGQGLMRRGIEFHPDWYDYLQPKVLTAGQVDGRVQQFLALAESDRDRMRILLDRLIRSKQHHHVGNRAIDLAIAFEVLLLKNENEELTHRISLRAARLLGGDLIIRRRNRAYIRALYKIRSDMVHTGRVKNEQSVVKDSPKELVGAIVQEATRIFAELTQLILRRGAVPDWDAVELVEGM